MRYFCALVLLTVGSLCGTSSQVQEVLSSQKSLSLPELHGVIDNLVNCHAGKNRVDARILLESRREMVNLFDREKTYLLLAEVSPFIDNASAEAMEKAYAMGSFETYSSILVEIQKSIRRSREIRSGFFFTDLRSIERAKTTPVPEYTSFASSLDDLRERIFREYLAILSKHLPLGMETDPKEVEKAVAVAEKEFEEAEQPWLSMSSSTGEAGNDFAKTILKCFLLSFDAHSDVLTDSMAKVIRERLSKESFGSGLLYAQSHSGLRITKIIKGSPADRLGNLFPNDEITQIDGRSVFDMTDFEIAAKLGDASDDILTLTVVRNQSAGGQQTFQTNLPKSHYTINEDRVTSMIRASAHGNILILALSSFYRGQGDVSSEEDIKKAIDNAKLKGPIGGIILDLRANGGGYIAEAVRVVGLFIKTGIVMESVYADGSCLVFRDLDRGEAFSGPIIVLTSVATASAAEIATQALKDYGRAIVIGDPSTYGKGSIQMQTITDVSETGAFANIPMRMTIGNFYTVSGYCPQGLGVTADIVLPSCLPRRGSEKPLTGKNSTVRPMFQDRLGDLSLQYRGWYQEHYLPFVEPRTDTIRRFIPSLQEKSARRVEQNEAFFPLKLHPVVNTLSDEVRQQVYSGQLEEAVQIMNDLLNEMENTEVPSGTDSRTFRPE